MLSLAEELSLDFEEVSPMAFYRELFPCGELDKAGEYNKGKYRGIAIQVDDEESKVYKYMLCDDLEPLPRLVEEDKFLVISPISYAGKSQKQSNARFLYALTFDLDGLRIENSSNYGLHSLFEDMDEKEGDNKRLPRPTYLVASGTGLHVYYFLKRPIPLFPNVIEQLRNFRYLMTRGLWSYHISKYSDMPQYESVSQGFRAVGSITKDGKNRVRAFRVGEPVSMEYLNSKVAEKDRIKDFRYKSNLSLEEAKELYPNWYENRIVAGNMPGSWQCHRGLYDWWKKQLVEGANTFPNKDVLGVVDGHRYFGVMALAIYARKCGISEEELEQDALDLIPVLDARTRHEGNNFTSADVMKALEAYNASYITFPRQTIQNLTNINIPPNKRNGRTQEKHLYIARGIQQLYKATGETDKIGGRKSKKEDIKQYFKLYPLTTIEELANIFEVSERTVKRHIPNYKERRKEAINAYIANNRDMTQQELANNLGISRSTVARRIKELEDNSK